MKKRFSVLSKSTIRSKKNLQTVRIYYIIKEKESVKREDTSN